METLAPIEKWELSVNHRSNSDVLRHKIRLVSSDMRAAADAFWSHKHLADIYPEFLFKVYSISQAVVPMFIAARDCALARHSDDRITPMLAEYLTRHAEEETEHDEWVLEDLQALGINRADVIKRIPSASMASLLGAQYYWIWHCHPVAVLGYIAVIEGSPATIEQLEDSVRRTGHPSEAFGSSFKHARLDPVHRDDFNKFLDALPLTPEHSAMIGVSAFHTVNMIKSLFEEVIEKSPAATRSRAPS